MHNLLLQCVFCSVATGAKPPDDRQLGSGKIGFKRVLKIFSTPKPEECRRPAKALDGTRSDHKNFNGPAAHEETERDRKEVQPMSGPLFSYRHPFEIAQSPKLEPEVKRAILASWASDAAAVLSRPGLRKPPGVRRAVPIDDVLTALKMVDAEQRPTARSARG
jgi:hypothetical protein